MPGRAGAAVATFQINEPWMGGTTASASTSEDERKRRKEERRRKKRMAEQPASLGRAYSSGDLESVGSLESSPRGRRTPVRGDRTPPGGNVSESSGAARGYDAEQPGGLIRQASDQSGPSASSSRAHVMQIMEGPDGAAGPSAAARGAGQEQPALEEVSQEAGSRSGGTRDGTTPSPKNHDPRHFASLTSQDSGLVRVSSTAASSDSFNYLVAERRRVRRVMSMPQFDAVIGVIILANCITIGLEQEYQLKGKDTSVFEALESVYLFVYLIELIFRFFGYGLSAILDNWVKFDAFLVMAGLLTGWPISHLIGELNELGPLMVLRTARLMRLARTVRLLIKFRELWMLVRGLLNSASTMLYTLLMLIVIIYIFSCMAIELITNHELARGSSFDPDFREFVDEHFRNLPMTMITLLQFASLDNMNLLYMPLIKKSWWLAWYFIGLILVVSIVLMNLITAVVVNSALEQAMSDKEAMKAQQNKQRKRLMKDLRRMFVALDDDCSGQVSLEEMMSMTEDDKNLLYNVLGVSDPSEVFKQLDIDNSGLLEIEEFCDGIWQVAISNAPIELKRIEKQVNNLKANILDSISKQQGVQEMLDTILSTINNQFKITATSEGEESQIQVGDQLPTYKTSSSQDAQVQFAQVVESADVVLGQRPLMEVPIEKPLTPKQDAEEPPAWAGTLVDTLRRELCKETAAMKESLEDTVGQVSKLFGAKELPRKRIISLGEPMEMMNIPSWALDLKLELLERAEALKDDVQDIFVNLNEELQSRASAMEAVKEVQNRKLQEQAGLDAGKPQRGSWNVFGSFWSSGRRETQPEVAEEAMAVRAIDTQSVEEALSQTQEALSQTQEALTAHTAALSARKDEEDNVSKPPAWADNMMSELQRINSSLELQSRRLAEPKKVPLAEPKKVPKSEKNGATPTKTTNPAPGATSSKATSSESGVASAKAAGSGLGAASPKAAKSG